MREFSEKELVVVLTKCVVVFILVYCVLFTLITSIAGFRNDIVLLSPKDLLAGETVQVKEDHYVICTPTDSTLKIIALEDEHQTLSRSQKVSEEH